MCKHAGRDVRCIDQAQPFLDAALRHRLFYLGGYVDKFLPVFSVEPEILGVGFHCLNYPFDIICIL